jgi:transmembrane sensor
MERSRFIELMAKRIGKSATEEELQELEIFLKENPGHRNMQSVAKALKLKTKQSGDSSEERDLTEGLYKLWERIGEAESRQLYAAKEKRSYRIWTAAAAILVACLTGFYFYIARPTANESDRMVMNTIYVPFGKTRKLILPDGTRVQLNSGSTISWPGSFAGDVRQVSLKGEGFFDVTKNKKKPFLVVTDQLTIKVLGTVFNVKAYQDDKNTETTLLKGKVQVQLKDRPEKNIILLPNEKLVVMNESSMIEDPVNNKEARTEYQLKKLPGIKPEEIKETAWLSNRLVFINESFESVARQMERKYNVQLVFDDQELKTEQLSGVLEKESLENALEIIKLTTPLKFRMEGRTIHILHQ